MQGRMSRLRRSLSRSVLQLQAVQALSRSSSNIPQLDATSAPEDAHAHHYATPSTFPVLRKTVEKNNEILRDIVHVFDEKAQLDLHYSRSLQKLAARLHKLASHAESDSHKPWTSAAEQFEAHSIIHSNLGNSFIDDIVQPLRGIQQTEEKAIRATGIYVDREIRRLTERRNATVKAKKVAYNESKELERLEQSTEQRTSIRKTKAQENTSKLEQVYVFEAIDHEIQRGKTSNALTTAVATLAAIEKQRAAHTQTALGRLLRKIEQLGPSLAQMFTRHTNNLEMALVATEGGFPAIPATPTIVPLIDTFAENFGEVMKPERRKAALTRLSMTLQSELHRLYEKHKDHDDSINEATDTTLTEYVEYLYYKVNESINSMERIVHRGYHKLAQYERKSTDKMGLPSTQLSIPCKCEYGQTTTNTTDIDYQEISNEGFYQSKPSTTISEATTEPLLCRVLYDFQPQESDELEIRTGECVLVEEQLGGWLRGRVVSPHRGSVSGRFPTSYVAF